LLKLRTEGLERLELIREHYTKAHALCSARKGSQDKAYLTLQQQISEEMMGIRFTSKTIERLCDTVRAMVEEARACERKIQRICVDTVRMPRPHFIKVFPRQRTQHRLGGQRRSLRPARPTPRSSRAMLRTSRKSSASCSPCRTASASR
jgi:hypothetical protein